MSRRRTRVNELTTIYWRDIPAQVTATHSGETFKALLSPRFQVAIDRAATVADLTETSAYVAEWRRQSSPLQTDVAGEIQAQQRATELETTYDRETLEAIVAAGGLNAAEPSPQQPNQDESI